MFFRTTLAEIHSDIPGLQVIERGRLTWLRYFGIPAAVRFVKRHWQTWLAAISLALILSYVGPAGATGPKPEPKPAQPAQPTTPVQYAPVHNTQQSLTSNPTLTSTNNLAAGAQAGSTSTSNAASDSQSTSAASTGPITVQGDSVGGSSYKAWAIGFPPPVYASSAAINGCTIAGNEPAAGGWNFLSYSPMKVFAERTCVMLTLARDAWETCQFASAVTIRHLLAEELLDDETRKRLPPLNVSERNWSADECHALKRPQTQVVQQPLVQILAEGGKAEAAAVAVDQQPARAPARAPKGAPRCPDGKTWKPGQCTPDAPAGGLQIEKK